MRQLFQKAAVGRVARMEQVVDKKDPLMGELETYKHANRMRTLGSFEDLLEVVEGEPVVASVKVDGEINALGWDGREARLVSLAGRVRKGLPLTDEATRKLRGKGPSTFVMELYGVDDQDNELPYPQAISLLRKPKTEQEAQRIRAAVFDVLQYDGKDISKEPYWKRLTIATNIFGNGTYVKPVYATEDGASTVERLWNQQVLTEGHEGLVVRTDDHYKIKPVTTFDLAVIGIEKSKSHPEWAGALLLAFMDEQERFLDAGKVGSGLTHKDREDWIKWANRYKVDEEGSNIYVDPFAGDRVVEIRHEGLNPVARPAWKFEKGEFESAGQARSTALRKPVIVRLREDKHVNPSDVRADQLPVPVAARLAQGRPFAATEPPQSYYKGADGANYLMSRLLLEKAEEEFGFLDGFLDQYGVIRWYVHTNNLDPKFGVYFPQALSQVVQAHKEGLKRPTGAQSELLGEWKELWGDPLLSDEDVATFVDQTPEAKELEPEEQREFAEWGDLLTRWDVSYQEMLHATLSTPEYTKALEAHGYSPKELERVSKDPSAEPMTIWEEYYDDVHDEFRDYIFERLVDYYESSPAGGWGFMHAFGTDQRDQFLRDLQGHYGVSGIGELHEYTSQNLRPTEQEREFLRWLFKHRRDLEDAVEEMPSYPLTLLVQDITGEEYEIPLGKIEETQELFVELENDLQKAFEPARYKEKPGAPAWTQPTKAAVVYIRSDSPLWAMGEDLESLAYRKNFGGSSGRPGNIMYLEIPQMATDFEVLPISLSGLDGLRREYPSKVCVCPADGSTHPKTEEQCELQECPSHPGIYLQPSGPPLFGDIQEKMEEMYDAGERLFEPAEIDKALENVENTIVGAEPNIVVYYAAIGPLAQEAKVRGGLGMLEMYTGHTIFLPSTELAEGFEVVDNIPDELFTRLKGAVDAGQTAGLPSLTQLRERGRFVAYKPDEVTEEVMAVDDALDFASPNTVVYYATSGPLGWGISTQAEEVASLGLYGADVLFLPTNELSTGFEIVDGIPEEQFESIKETRPELSAVQEQGLGASRGRADEEFRSLIDELDSAVRAGRTPIAIEISPEADFYRYRTEEEYPYRNALDQWLAHLGEQYPDIVISTDIVPDLEQPFLIPAMVPEEVTSARISTLPRNEETLLEELIRVAQDEPEDIRTTELYMAYTLLTDKVPESYAEIQLAVIDDPSVADAMAKHFSEWRGEPVTTDDILHALDVKEYLELAPPPMEAPEVGIETPPGEPEVPVKPFEPLSEEEVQEEYNNLMAVMPRTVDFLQEELAKEGPKREYYGVEIFISPTLHGTMRAELLEEIYDLAYTRGVKSPGSLNIDILTKTPSQLEDERSRVAPIFRYIEVPEWERAVEWREEFDPKLTEQLMIGALNLAELSARQMEGGMIHFYIHPDLLRQLGEPELSRVLDETLDPPFDSPDRTKILVDEDVPEKGFYVVPWRSGMPTEPRLVVRPPEKEFLPTPTRPVREPAEYPSEVAEEFLKTRQDFDVEMEAALESAILSLTTRRKLFSADAQALLDLSRRTSFRIPRALQELFRDRGIEVAKDTTMRPMGVRDLMFTGEEQSYYLKVSPDGWMDAYALSSEYQDVDEVDNLEDGVNAAGTFIEAFPDISAPDIQVYWETKIQPNKPDAFCTGFATVMQMYGIPLTRTINVGDPDRPDIQRSNGRADALSFIERSLAERAGAPSREEVKEHLESVLRGGGLTVTDPYAQGWFEGLNQEGYPPMLLGYPGVLLQKHLAPEEEITEELWNFRQEFMESARNMGYSDEQILSAIGDPERLQRAYERHQQQKTSSLLPRTEETFLAELIRIAQEGPEPTDPELLEELVREVLGPLPEEAPPEPTEPPIEAPEEVSPEVEEEYAKVYSAVQGLDWENTVGVYIYAEPTLYAFIGGTPGIQSDLVADGWDEELTKSIFVISDASLSPAMMSMVQTVSGPDFEETLVHPEPGFRHDETGAVWTGSQWLIPEEQVYEYSEMRFVLLNQPPFGTREPWYPVRVTWAPEESGTEPDKEYTMPLEWLQAAEPVDDPEPTAEELAERLWERGRS